ncbi:MAG: hypothetical protein ABL894_12375 [Hyphomicrobium sp.]
MRGKPVVSGIGAVFNSVMAERFRQRVLREAASRMVQVRGQEPAQAREAPSIAASSPDGQSPRFPGKSN